MPTYEACLSRLLPINYVQNTVHLRKTKVVFTFEYLIVCVPTCNIFGSNYIP
jgi:hypothetical protein